MDIRPLLATLLFALATVSTPASSHAAETQAAETAGGGTTATTRPGETRGAGDADTEADTPIDDAAPKDGGGARDPAATADDGATASPPSPLGAPAPLGGSGGSRRPSAATPPPFAPGGSDTRPRPEPSAPRPAVPSFGDAVPPPSRGPHGLPALSTLRQTRDRPLFVPARRGVQPEPAAPVFTPPPAPEPVEEAAPPLTLTLTGVVAGPDVEVAILVDPSDGTTKRMRIGDEHDGWRLTRIDRVAVTFHRDGEEAVLALKPPGVSPSDHRGHRPGAPPVPGQPPMVEGQDGG